MEQRDLILYDNYNTENYDYYDYYCEVCAEDEIEPSDEDSPQYREWLWQTLQIEWESFMSNLKYDEENNVDCVVLGEVGLWYGRRDIEPTYFKTLKDAIYACIKDCDYITITQTEEGVIEVRASHHDGTHYFEIHKLNDDWFVECDEEEIDKPRFWGEFNVTF